MKNKKVTLQNLVPQILIDIICIVFSYWAAYVLALLRYDGRVFSDRYDLQSFCVWIPWVTLLFLFTFTVFYYYSKIGPRRVRFLRDFCDLQKSKQNVSTAKAPVSA